MTTPTVSFTTGTSYLAKFVETANAPAGHTNQAFMIGKDNHLYALAYTDQSTVVIMDATSGNSKTLTTGQLDADMIAMGLVPHTTSATHFSVPGTPYFWYIGFNAGTLHYNYAAVMYRIDDINTITPVSGINEATVFATDGLKYVSVDFSVGAQTITAANEVWTVGQVSGVGIADPTITSLLKLPLTEGYFSYSGDWGKRWTDLPSLGTTFFRYLRTNTLSSAGAAILPATDTYNTSLLIYVNKGGYDYATAHPGVNTIWDTWTGPVILLLDLTTGFLKDITAKIDLSDAMHHLDNTSSADYRDDYQTPNAFQIAGQTFINFIRSYTGTDLGATGTYIRSRIFTYDGYDFTSVYDAKTSLFDMVGNLGVSSGNKDNYPPSFVQYYPFSNKLYYMWYSPLGLSGLHTYVFGQAGTITLTYPQVQVSSFASIHDPSYKDWVSVDDVGQDFTAYFLTYYMPSEKDFVFMQAPWVVTYMENVGTNPALTLQPIWDWCDDSSKAKYAASSECYKARAGQLVLDNKHRVRGKGRALQLKFTSENGKPFSIIGWSINLDSNTGP